MGSRLEQSLPAPRQHNDGLRRAQRLKDRQHETAFSFPAVLAEIRVLLSFLILKPVVTSLALDGEIVFSSTYSSVAKSGSAGAPSS